MTALSVENKEAQYISAVSKLIDDKYSILYDAFVIPGSTQTITVDAKSTAIAWIFKGLNATSVAENDRLRLLYDTVSLNEKVQELADYIALLQKDNMSKWVNLDDVTLKQKFQDALYDILQKQQVVNRSMSEYEVPEIDPLVKIVQAPENADIYFENRKNDGDIWIVNDTRLFLSVEVVSKEDGEEYFVDYKHPTSIENMQYVNSIVAPKGWPIFGIASEKRLQLHGIDSFVEIIVGAYGDAEGAQVREVSKILKGRVYIEGIAVPMFNSLLSLLMDRTIPKNHSYENIVKGLNDIYGGNMISQLLTDVSNEDTTWTILADTYGWKPIKRTITGCITNPTGGICMNSAKGLLLLAGIDSEAVLKTLAKEIANKFKNELIEDAALAQLGEAGFIARVVEFTWKRLGDIANGISIVESKRDMEHYPQVIDADIEFALKIEEISPLCVAVTHQTQDVTFELKGDGFVSQESEVPYALLRSGISEVESENTVAFNAGHNLDAIFSSPGVLVSDGSINDASLFIRYTDGLTMMYPEWIKIVDSSDDVVYFDSIEPQSAYRGATVALKGCGWIPTNDIKVYFSEEHTTDEYVVGEVLSSTVDTIKVKVPNTAKSGTVYVTAGSKTTKKLLFDINPFSFYDLDKDDHAQRGESISLSGLALSKADKLYVIDHTGKKIEVPIDQSSDDSIDLTLPKELALGSIDIYAEDDKGNPTNVITLPLIPVGVDANPPSKSFLDSIQVTLTQKDNVDIFYHIDGGEEQKYIGPIIFNADDAKYEYFSIYVYARVVVNDINYTSNELEYQYAPIICKAYEELVDGECIYSYYTCPMVYDPSLDDDDNLNTLIIPHFVLFEQYTKCRYFDSAQLWWEIPYDREMHNGKSKYYFESGQLRSETPYIDNEIDGVDRMWYESGQLNYEIPYTQDKRDGVEKDWYKSGKIERELTWMDDIIIGTIKQWYDTDQHQLECQCPHDVNGKMDGLRLEWYSSGRLKQETPYTNNQKNGIDKKYYDSDAPNKYFEIPYVDGKENGISQSWYESGFIKSIYNYIDGKLNGMQKYYSSIESGKMTSCWNYDMGIKIGSCMP